MSTVPGEILAKLPIGPAFEKLPETWQAKIRSIHANTSIGWSDKNRMINELIDSLPPQFRQLLPSKQIPPSKNNAFPSKVSNR